MGTPGCPYLRGVYIFMTPGEFSVSHLKRSERVSEEFHGGENDVYKPLRYINSPARDSEDFHGVENVVYKPSRYLNRFAPASEDFHGG